jgi:hypothetical protein
VELAALFERGEEIAQIGVIILRHEFALN